MSARFAGYAAGALLVGLWVLPECAAQPSRAAVSPGRMDVTRVPTLKSEPVVSPPVFMTHPLAVRSDPEERAYTAMREGTAGMPPGAVVGGSKEPLTVRAVQPLVEKLPPLKIGPVVLSGPPKFTLRSFR